jgi:hypothetical protein
MKRYYFILLSALAISSSAFATGILDVPRVETWSNYTHSWNVKDTNPSTEGSPGKEVGITTCGEIGDSSF